MENKILEILNKELLYMQEKENKGFDSFLAGRIDAYEEIIYMIEEELYNFHKQGWGGQDCWITEEQLKDLYNGKILTLDDGEYTHTFKLKF